MNTLSTLFIALLTAVAACIASGFVASLCVDWYHISGREGGSGYFIAALGLLGGILGLVIGIVASRLLVGSGELPFFRSLGLALGFVFGLAAVATAIARMLADVPPRLNGEPLMLAVEVRWPEGSASPSISSDDGFLQLYSIPYFSHTVRTSVKGALWKKDARLIDGRWVAPGAVEVFTSRGKRMLQIAETEKTSEYFQVSLPAYPGKSALNWSEWLPRTRQAGAALANRFTYRYRAQLCSAAVRTETVGPFSVSTSIRQFYEAQINDKPALAAVAQFALGYKGEPLPIGGKPSASESQTERFDRADHVAVVGGANPALLVQVDAFTGSGKCFLLSADESGAHFSYVCEGGQSIQAIELTSDVHRFRQASHRTLLRGRLDRETFEHPGLYLFGKTVLNTRSGRVYRFEGETPYLHIPSVPPLALSPDERSYVWFAYAENSAQKPVLAVTDFVANRTYALPIDPARMRYANFAALDPEWVNHHFAWRHDTTGTDQLFERGDFAPLPYRGKLSGTTEAGYEYRLEPAGEALRTSVVDFLVEQFHAERLPCAPNDYEHLVRIENKRVKIACSEQTAYVLVTMDSTTADPELVRKIAQQFDIELATGKYDALFGYGSTSYRY